MRRYRQVIRFAFFFLILLGMSICCKASLQPEYYYQWMSLSSEQLLKMGNQYCFNTQAPDSALACYTIVSNRYSKYMSKQQRRDCVRANIGKWYVYFFCFFDYAKSYESLSKAEELSTDMPEAISRIYLNFGAMYQTMAEQGKDQKTLRKALSYYKKCFAVSIKAKSEDFDMAFANIVSVSSDLGELSRIATIRNQYAQLEKQHSSVVRRYALLLYDGNSYLTKRQYAKAETCYRQQEVLVKDDPSRLRYLIFAKINCAKTRRLQGDMAGAGQLLHEALSLAAHSNMKDAELELYDHLAELYALQGDILGENRFRNNYLALKDTLLNYRQLMSVSEMRFVNSMKRVDEQMGQMELRRQRQLLILGVVIGAALLILCFLLVLWRKNKRLREQNKNLYTKTLATLRNEEKERKRCETLEQELSQIKESIPQRKEKYTYNNLSNDDKQILASRILRVMETCGEIYSPEFSLERLSELVGSRYKLVSQVINETCQMNFSTFLNEYRVKEACRQMSDREHYGNLTIEAISQGVGFKSRASFISAFKKFTGLTPSQFLKIADREG